MNNEINIQTQRNSSIELLRLLCCWGIIALHTFGEYYNTCHDGKRIYGVLINSICNIDICTFVLITGYFGIEFSLKRFLKIEMQLIFYSVVSFCIICIGPIILHNQIHISNLIREFIISLFPTISFFNRFFSNYIVLMLLGKWINKSIENITKKDFIIILLIIISFFSIFQTIFPNGIQTDTGKGFPNMIMMYLIGRFIKLHLDNLKIHYINIIFCILIIFCIEIGLNLYCSLYLKKSNPGIYAPFAKDSSIFIITASILIFIISKSIQFYNRILNFFAKTISGIVIFNPTIILICRHFSIFDRLNTYNTFKFILLIIILNFLIMFICQLIEIIRMYTFNRFTYNIYIKSSNILNKLNK